MKTLILTDDQFLLITDALDCLKQFNYNQMKDAEESFNKGETTDDGVQWHKDEIEKIDKLLVEVSK